MNEFFEGDLLDRAEDAVNEADYTRIRSDNDNLIQRFGSSLKKKDYSEKDIYRILSMTDLYVNSYLLDNLSMSAAEGIGCVDDFFMEYFPENVIWASEDSVGNMMKAIKAFYRFLLEHGMIERSEFRALSAEIKEKRAVWRSVSRMPELDDPDDDEFDLGDTL